MTYEEYKVIEQWFHLGEVIENVECKIAALKNIQSGYISLQDANILQRELSEFGLVQNESLSISKLKETLSDELDANIIGRNELMEIARDKKVDLIQVILEKEKFELETTLTLLTEKGMIEE